MDESLRKLIRTCEANPGDLPTAQRAITAAKRADEPEQTQDIVTAFLPKAYSALQANVLDLEQRTFLKEHDPLRWCGFLCALARDDIPTYLVVEPGREFYVQLVKGKAEIPSVTLTKKGLHFLLKRDPKGPEQYNRIFRVTEKGLKGVEQVEDSVNRIMPWDNFRTYGMNNDYLPERFNRVFADGLEHDFRRNGTPTELGCIHTSEHYAFAAIGRLIHRLTQRPPGGERSGSRIHNQRHWRGSIEINAGPGSRMIKNNRIYQLNADQDLYSPAPLFPPDQNDFQMQGENITASEGLPVIPNSVTKYSELAFGFNRDNSRRFIQIPITVIDSLYALTRREVGNTAGQFSQPYFG